MYLVLRPPWAHAPTAVVDAGVVASAPGDAPAKSGKKKPRRHPGGGGAPGLPGSIEADGDESGAETPTIVLSASDRVTETRGDDVSLPKQKIDMGAAGEARPLDDGEIQATVSGQSRAMQDCVIQGATNTDLRSATVTVQLVVDGTGKVAKLRLAAPRYLLEHGLINCARGAAAHMKFPSTGAPTLVTFPINLT